LIGPHVKASDYALTLHGQRKFFLEAKKPSVNIKGDVAPSKNKGKTLPHIRPSQSYSGGKQTCTLPVFPTGITDAPIKVKHSIFNEWRKAKREKF
jgi:hypothetical protein